MRWTLARDPEGERWPLTLCCIDHAICSLQVLAWYLGRWNLEATFEELRHGTVAPGRGGCVQAQLTGHAAIGMAFGGGAAAANIRPQPA